VAWNRIHANPPAGPDSRCLGVRRRRRFTPSPSRGSGARLNSRSSQNILGCARWRTCQPDAPPDIGGMKNRFRVCLQTAQADPEW